VKGAAFAHRDPFDRLLIAQAMTEPATLYTADRQLLPYSDRVRRIGATKRLPAAAYSTGEMRLERSTG